MFNVQDILSSINTSGVAQQSHFTVELTNKYGEGERDLVARANAVNLPGRTVTTTEHKFTNYGPINKVPYAQIYSDSTISFLLSEDLREKDYFENWQNQMVDTGAYNVDTGNRSFGTFNTKYFENYIGTVTIRQYGADSRLRTIHKLAEAYPILIGDVDMSWGSEDLAKMSVTFAYKNYQFVTVDNSNQPTLGRSLSVRLTNSGISGNFAIPGLGNINHSNGKTNINSQEGINSIVHEMYKGIKNK